MSDTSLRTTAATLGDDVVAAYRRDGFVHLPGVISPQNAERFRQAALAAQHTTTALHDGRMYTQLVQLWEHDETLRELTLDASLAGIAARLAGIPLRLWHDQLLIKAPHNGVATEFHQDQPGWPHTNVRHAMTAWIALVDVPVERGCMTFIPGSQHRRGLRVQDLTDSADLFSLAPDLAWQQRVTAPLRAGDCTFHDSFVAHTASPNLTDEPRIAHLIHYVDAAATYSGELAHPITELLGLAVGQTLPDGPFPRFN